MNHDNKQIEIFKTPDGQINLQVQLKDDTVWLSTEQMANLFGRERSVLTKHINNGFKEGELDVNSTCAKFAQVHFNQRLFDKNGEVVINDTGLAALTLLVAESDPKQKDILIKLIMNMLSINQKKGKL